MMKVLIIVCVCVCVCVCVRAGSAVGAADSELSAVWRPQEELDR